MKQLKLKVIYSQGLSSSSLTADKSNSSSAPQACVVLFVKSCCKLSVEKISVTMTIN